MIISDPNLRLARREEKRQLVMSFLRDEIWSTPAVLGELIQVQDKTSIMRLLRSLEKDHLVVLDREGWARPKKAVAEAVEAEKTKKAVGSKMDVGPRPQLIVGITPHGQAMASDGKELIERAYEIGRLPKTQFLHRLDLQRLRIRCERAGWQNWRSFDHVTLGEHGRFVDYKRPDATVVHPSLGMVAIECERTIKTKKRYQAIIRSHLTEIHDHGAFYGVIWACPTAAITRALGSVIKRIECADSRGKNLCLDLEERPLLHVVDYQHITDIGDVHADYH